MAHLQFFPPEILTLQEEVYKHPPLVEILRNKDSKYFEDHLAEICTYCGIAIDSDLDIQAVCLLAEQLTKELYSKRTSIIIS